MISRKQCMQVSIGCTTCGQTPHPHLAVCMSEDALGSHLRLLCFLHSRGLLFWGDGSAVRLERRLLCCNRCHKWHHVLDVVFVFQHPPPFLRDGRSDRSNGTRSEPIPIQCSDCDVLARRQSCPAVEKQPASVPMEEVCSIVLAPWWEEECVAFVSILRYDGPNTACKCRRLQGSVGFQAWPVLFLTLDVQQGFGVERETPQWTAPPAPARKRRYTVTERQAVNCCGARWPRRMVASQRVRGLDMSGGVATACLGRGGVAVGSRGPERRERPRTRIWRHTHHV
jgi:hypothetical protein